MVLVHDAEPLAHQGFSEELALLIRVMDFSFPALCLSVQVTLLVSQYKEHSRRGHNAAAAAVTLSPLEAEGKTVKGKANTAFAVPHRGSCHPCRAFWCIHLRTRLPLFQIAIEQIACTKQGVMEAFLRRGRLASCQAHITFTCIT